jgi:hypothetical protein
MYPPPVSLSFQFVSVVGSATASYRVRNLGALCPGHLLWNNVKVQPVARVHCLKKTLYQFTL